jgi:hypothetical protein
MSFTRIAFADFSRNILKMIGFSPWNGIQANVISVTIPDWHNGNVFSIQLPEAADPLGRSHPHAQLCNPCHHNAHSADNRENPMPDLPRCASDTASEHETSLVEEDQEFFAAWQAAVFEDVQLP